MSFLSSRFNASSEENRDSSTGSYTGVPPPSVFGIIVVGLLAGLVVGLLSGPNFTMQGFFLGFVGWVVKHQLLLWPRNLRGSIWRSHDSTWRGSHRKEGGGYLMSGSTGEGRRPSPVPRAVLAGLIAGIAAGLVSYYVINSVLGLIIGFIAGAIVGSRTVLLMNRAREQDK